MIAGIAAIISLLLATGGYAWLQHEIPFLPQISTSNSPLSVILPSPASPFSPTSPTAPVTPTSPPSYEVAIWAWDQHGWQIVPITIDGVPSGFSTPHTFEGLTGTHTFTVPSTDSNSYAFTNWYTGQTGTTITINSAGTFTARYGPVPETTTAG